HQRLRDHLRGGEPEAHPLTARLDRRQQARGCRRAEEDRHEGVRLFERLEGHVRGLFVQQLRVGEHVELAPSGLGTELRVAPEGAAEHRLDPTLADQHQKRSNRSTSITNATAPPTWTFTGLVRNVPTGVASGGRTFTYCSRVLQESLMTESTFSTSSLSAL